MKRYILKKTFTEPSAIRQSPPTSAHKNDAPHKSVGNRATTQALQRAPTLQNDEEPEISTQIHAPASSRSALPFKPETPLTGEIHFPERSGHFYPTRPAPLQGSFLSSQKKDDGISYPPSTLQGYDSSLQSHNFAYNTAPSRFQVPGKSTPPIQRLRKDAKKYIGQNSLGVSDKYYDVLEYIRDERNPDLHRQGLRAAWNIGQTGHYLIPETARPPDLSPEKQLILIAFLMTMFQGESSSEIIESFPEESSILMGQSSSMGSSLRMEEEHKMGGLPDSFSHFKTGKLQKVGFTKDGQIMDIEEGRKASGVKRRNLFKNLGVGEHVLRGHFFDDETLLSQIGLEKSNFTFENDQSFITVMEIGRRGLAETQKKFIEFNAPPSGHGFIKADNGKIYRVIPKFYRVVRMQEGDFKTAYGVTEETNPKNFDTAYYSAMPVD